MEPPPKQPCSSSTAANVAAIDENSSPFSSLPNHIIYHMFMTNQSRDETDLSRLRAVNRSWRDDLAEVPQEETHLDVPNHDNNGDSPKLFLRQSCFYLISPPNPADGVPWLVRLIKLEPQKWQLINPVIDEITPDYFIADPPINAKINLSDFRVLELAKSFCLVRNLYYATMPISKKVVGGRVRYRTSGDEKFTALVQLEEDERNDEVLLWKFGDQQWTRIRVGPTFEQQQEKLQYQSKILDMAFHNGKFYIFYITSMNEWEIGVINPDNNSCSILRYPLRFMYNNPEDEFVIMQYINDIRLTSTNDALYFFYKESMSEDDGESISTIMSAFLIKDNELVGEEEESYWECERLNNLDDQTFFLGFGDNVSFALQSSAEKLPQWEPGTICWFDRPDLLFYLDGHGVEERFPLPEGVKSLRRVEYPYYNLYFTMAFPEEGIRAHVSKFRAMGRENQEMYTRLFFPPPNWVRWYCPTLDVEVKLDGLQFHELGYNR
ncbi:hypothetical protein BVRB_4g076820 [Beta vulgaris subsp. vulgaris]|nr:hypothetical protein BVRB_4g076820 [Beta vulgaris subsp. vulgaris]